MSLPKKAKRVFKGEMFEVWQWRQKLFDGTYATFERLKRPPSVSVLPVWNGQIVIAREQQPDTKPFVGLIAGRSDDGESPLAAAKRELLEETGLTSRDWELVLVDQPSTKIEWKIYFYLARNCQKVAKQKLDGGEKIKLLRLSFENFLRYCTANKLRDREVAHYIVRQMLNRKTLQQFKKKLFK